MYIEDDNLVIKQNDFFFFNIVIVSIEYLDTSYPIPSIFKINIHRSLRKSSSKLSTQKAEDIKKKRDKQEERKIERVQDLAKLINHNIFKILSDITIKIILNFNIFFKIFKLSTHNTF